MTYGPWSKHREYAHLVVIIVSESLQLHWSLSFPHFVGKKRNRDPLYVRNESLNNNKKMIVKFYILYITLKKKLKETGLLVEEVSMF